MHYEKELIDAKDVRKCFIVNFIEFKNNHDKFYVKYLSMEEI